MSVTAGGLVLSVVAVVQVLGSLAVPVVIKRSSDQRWLAGAAAIINAAGLIGVMIMPVPTGVWVSAAVLGFGQGIGFGLAMTLIGLRAQDPVAATGLSGMAQGIGYAFAAAGPLATGLLQGVTGTWLAALALLVAVCAVQFGTGMVAGRQGEVSVHRNG